MEEIEQLNDQLQVLYQQEVSTYHTIPYQATVGDGNFSFLWRDMLCEWAYNIVDHFDMRREIVSVCMNFVDRYIGKVTSLGEVIKKQPYQLLVVTSLYLAIKLNKSGSPTIPIKTMAYLSREQFTPDQIAKMELEILTTLQWHVHPPTPYVFLRHYMPLVPQDFRSEVLSQAKYLLEIAVFDSSFIGHSPSTIAVAALLNSLESVPGDQRTLHMPYIYSLVNPNERYYVQKCQTRLRVLLNGPQRTSSPVSVAESPIETW